MINIKTSKLAAIYVSEEFKQQVSITHQIETCQKFLSENHLIFSRDLFLEKRGNGPINQLDRARAKAIFHYFDEKCENKLPEV
jgi:hypothetical protein